MKLNFDMDGLWVDLYSVENWKQKLDSEDTTPYRDAKPLLNLSLFARYLNMLQKAGNEIYIISWLARNGSPTYNEAVEQTKLKYIQQHLKSVDWDDIYIIPYGTPKNQFCTSPDDILFDDELNNRESWNGKSYDETEVLQVLKELIQEIID